MNLKLLWIWIQNGFQKGTHIWKNVIKTGLESQKRQVCNMCTRKWQKQHKYMSWKAWFWCSCLHGITVFTFADLLNQCQALLPKAFEIESYGRRQEQKDGSREVWKTCEKHHHKSANICHKLGPKGGSPKVIFCMFFWVPSRDGLQGVPGQIPRPKDMLKWRPRCPKGRQKVPTDHPKATP